MSVVASQVLLKRGLGAEIVEELRTRDQPPR
jgi:hypothetical protein